MNQKRVVIGRAILALGLLLLLLPLVQWGLASYWQHQALQPFVVESDFVGDPQEIKGARWTARLQPGEQQPGKTREPDRIEIPKIKLEAAVLPGITPDDLKHGPGLYPQSAEPSVGNVSIAAHRGVYGSWFRHLDKLEYGDEILLYLKGKQYTYSVREQFTTHDRNWSVIESNGRAELTLTTCLFGTSSKRLIVKADLVEP